MATITPNPSFRLHTLGRLALESGDGVALDPVLQQPKRLILLAYLVLADGPRRRDSLLALFWPELSEKRARNALNKAIHHLRVHLGRDIIESRGAEEVRLADGWIQCDAVEFERARDAGRPEAAVGLYGGSFMEGVHVATAPELEHWIDRWRERMERRYAAALGELAARAETRSDPAAAARWWRRLRDFEPFEAGPVLGLMKALEGVGERAAALQEAERHAELLRTELDAEPDPEVSDLAERLRRSPSPVPARPVAAADNLPRPPTVTVGREGEIVRLLGMIADPAIRLVTLTGPGGVGKTRLAVETARRALARFPDGVFYVNLGTLRDPGLVAVTVARTAGIVLEAGSNLEERLREGLHDRRCLLLLDGFEAVLPAARQITALLETTDGPKVLVTSRAVLQLRGEQVLPVPPLAVPDGGPEGDLLACGSVELFVQRATAADPDFELTESNREAVARICAGLDGLPLAIELAAARVRLLEPAMILARLGRRFDLLSVGPLDLPERQRTLRRTFDWSYDLLSERQRRLFRRMCVFVGGCSLEAVHAVCYPESESEAAVLEDLGALVDNSLVDEETVAGGEGRFRMLDTIREYGRELLAAREERADVERAHARYFLDLAERAEPRLADRRQAVWLDRLEDEFGNVQAVLDWALDHGEVEFAVRLGSRLWWFWWLRGHFTEMRWRLDQGLAGRGALPPSLRANLLIARGAVASLDGEHERALELFQEALDLGRSRLAEGQVTRALRSMAFALSRRGEYERAVDLLEESLAFARESSSPREVTAALRGLAKMALHVRSYDRAESLYADALDQARADGDGDGEAWALYGLSEVARHRGDFDRAAALLEDGLDICLRLDSKPGIAYLRLASGHVARYQGHLAIARHRYEEALELLLELGNRRRVGICLLGLAALDAREGAYERALILMGAVDPVSEGIRLAPVDQAEYERTAKEIRARLEDAEIERLRRRGRELDPSDLLALALDREQEAAPPVPGARP